MLGWVAFLVFFLQNWSELHRWVLLLLVFVENVYKKNSWLFGWLVCVALVYVKARLPAWFPPVIDRVGHQPAIQPPNNLIYNYSFFTCFNILLVGPDETFVDYITSGSP